MRTRPGFRIYFTAVQQLMIQLEEVEFGRDFGLIMHFDMHLTLSKILQLTKAACKKFNHAEKCYRSKVLLRDPWRADMVVHVPRLAPPRHKLEKDLKLVYEQLGIDWAEDGKVAFVSFHDVVQQLMMQDPGIGMACRR